MLAWKAFSQPSSSSGNEPPALLMRMSMRPSCAAVSAHHALDVGGDGDVGDDRRRAHAARRDLARRRAQRIFAAGDQRDVAAFARKRQRDRTADAA